MNISLAPGAAVQLRDQADGRLLRISFTTGCGGSGYRLAWTDEPLEDDTVFDLEAVKVALDSMASSKLDGAVIVYDEVEDGFVIDHPDAAVAVWCG
jgi:Fe-S cluster assembly iron-binding protein IscA